VRPSSLPPSPTAERLGRPPRLSPTLLVCVLGVAGVSACNRGKTVHLGRPDGASAVVVVEPDAAPARDAGAVVPVVEEREPDDTRATAQPLTPGQAMRGYMHAATSRRGDVDYYHLTIPPRADGGTGLPPASVPTAPGTQPASAPQGRTPVDRSLVALKLTGVPGLDLRLEVLDERGELLLGVNDSRAGGGEAIPNLGLTPGSYYVRIRQAGRRPTADPAHPYLLTVTAAPLAPGEEVEPNNKLTWATELLPGVEVTGFLGWRRDEDWFRVPLDAVPAGATLRADLQGVPGVVAHLSVRDSIGTVLAEARGGRGDRVALRAVVLKPGEPACYVVVRADSGHSAEIRYALRAAIDLPGEPTEKEPNDDRAHATPLDGAGGALAGYIAAPGDADWYRLTSATPALARIEVSGPERVDPKLAVHDATGAELWRVDEGGRREPEVLVDVPVRGTVYVRVFARPGDANPDEPYRLTWKLEPLEGAWELEPNDEPRRATPWPPGAPSVRGYLHPRGDVDLFRVGTPGPAPAHLRASLANLPLLRLVLTLLVEEGGGDGGPPHLTVVTEAKPKGDGERVVEATLAPEKRYFLRVRDASGKASNPRDSYTLGLTLE
jgi:hypothetical protein